MSHTIKQYPLNSYPQSEEKLNIITHALGFIGAVLALIFMLIKTIPLHSSAHLL